MAQDPRIEAQIERGRKMAEDVFAYRVEAAKRRAGAIARNASLREKETETATAPTDAAAARSDMSMARAVRNSAGLIIAEGDSWLSYLSCELTSDISRMLDDEHGYFVDSKPARASDTLKQIATNPGQIEEVARAFERHLDTRPKAIVLSAGGNDVAGGGIFGRWLNDAGSGLPPIKDELRNLIKNDMRDNYAKVIGAVTALSEKYHQQRIPIVIHGYDYPVPDGEGHCYVGRWLKPGFQQNHYSNLAFNTGVMKDIIDLFNDMLKDLPTSGPNLAHVKWVDVRGAMPVNPGNVRTYWENELHPTPDGFRLVTNRVAEAL